MTSAYDPDPPAATPFHGLLLAAVVVMGVVALSSDLGTFLPRTHDQQAVVNVVERALVAQQSAAIPRARDATGAVAPDELARMRAEVRTLAGGLLTGAYRDSWTQLMDEIIERDRVRLEEFVFSGGADHFSRWHIDIRGNEATVQVRARIWLEQAQTLFGHRSVANNEIDCEVRLVQIEGVWRVAAFSHRFAPGGSP